MQMAFFIVALLMTMIIGSGMTMPYMQSAESDIRLASASLQLERLFDVLLIDDDARARLVLESAIKASLNPPTLSASPEKYRRLRQEHIRECNDAMQLHQMGFKGFYILQNLLMEHINLLMSIRLETRLLLSMMHSVYLQDIGPDALDTSQAWYEDRMALILLRYAQGKDYETWERFLEYAEEDDFEDESEDEYQSTIQY